METTSQAEWIETVTTVSAQIASRAKARGGSPEHARKMIMIGIRGADRSRLKSDVYAAVAQAIQSVYYGGAAVSQ